ncbi:hypothetical protein [Xenorhabdus bovienii]|uniref:hypothetical protein n=1 Tax=Xenorhabdus bovienii TaxID=40576 RepID=UPI0023B317DA|nr:hypothetical protein [Xenorhabdus bovienii]MDE9544557.1 hypothetical protein [Xenorhabdus bovienii]MDE9550724.1 hypothetical protein [Xenorhabdus bovienii]
MIWEDRRNEFIEAEFHAVVKINDRFIDITPRVNLEKEILFVEDNIRRSEKESSNAWFSYRNIKFRRDDIISHPKQILIKELDDINSEIIDLE